MTKDDALGRLAMQRLGYTRSDASAKKNEAPGGEASFYFYQTQICRALVDKCEELVHLAKSPEEVDLVMRRLSAANIGLTVIQMEDSWATAARIAAAREQRRPKKKNA